MTNENLKRVQEIDTEILFDVVDICERHHIEYFLMWGTLLGAVRHQGPIPWDDDVDIAMKRKDFLAFMDAAKTELSPKNEIVLMGYDVNYASLAKICRKGTVYCYPGTEDLDIVNKIQIDVLVLDSIQPMDNERGRKIYKRKKILRLASLNWDEKKSLINIAKRTHKKWFLYQIALMLIHAMGGIVGRRNLERIIYSMVVDKEGKSGLLGIASASRKSIWKAEAFEGTEKALYIDRELTIPKGYDHILSVHYGDYMKFPPEEKRYGKYFNEWIFKENEIAES